MFASMSLPFVSSMFIWDVALSSVSLICFALLGFCSYDRIFICARWQRIEEMVGFLHPNSKEIDRESRNALVDRSAKKWG